MTLRTVEWLPDSPESPIPGRVRMIDQTRLPGELHYLETTDLEQIWEAIKSLRVRGAPAIGVAAAAGLAAAAQNSHAESSDALRDDIARAGEFLATSRPTAVNLFWAIARMTRIARAHADLSADALRIRVAEEAMAIRDEDAAMCRAIGQHGLDLIRDCRTLMTICNAGSLATAEYGTALAPMYAAHEVGQTLHVYANETRPLLQGARLTAWELQQAGIPVTLITDNSAAHTMLTDPPDAILVGSDRIAANGDAANKIGTYGLALLAKAHGIPFYVLAPTSTIDPDLAEGRLIPIEERAPEEVTEGFGCRTAPADVAVFAPAFDVTPNALITAIVCERGVLRPPFTAAIAAALAND